MAAINVESLLAKMSEISKGIVYNIRQSLLKEWGPESLGVLPEDTIQQLLTGVIFYTFQCFHSFSHILAFNSLQSFCNYILFYYIYFQGIHLLELASHLEKEAAQLCREGLEKIKMALVGTDTSLLLGILGGSFGYVDLNTTTSSAPAEITEAPTTQLTTTEKSSEEPLEKVPVAPSEESSLAPAELVLPLKSVPLMI